MYKMLSLRYVLLKERNMLNTLRHEAKRQGVPMPSPQRCYKVTIKSSHENCFMGALVFILSPADEYSCHRLLVF